MASIRGSGYGGELFSKGKLVNPFRIALANIRFPATPEESIRLAVQAIDRASSKGARVICFPECFIPGYRGIGKHVPPPDPEFLARAWSVTAAAAAKANITVVLGTERFVDGALLATALVMNQDGSVAGFQDKVQIDPSEEGTYTPGSDRRVFQAGPLTFGIAICHEGWRYPASTSRRRLACLRHVVELCRCAPRQVAGQEFTVVTRKRLKA